MRFIYVFERDKPIETCFECPLSRFGNPTCGLGHKQYNPITVGRPADCPLEWSIKDEHGCIHESGLGWNPQGVSCGECTREDGPECPGYNATE